MTPAPFSEPGIDSVSGLLPETAEALAKKEMALMTLFHERRYVLVAICRKLGTKEDDIDDLLQEAWLVAHRNLGQLRDVQAILAWVRCILSTRGVNMVKRRRGARGTGADEDDSAEGGMWGVACDDVEPLGALLMQERLDTVRAGIAALSELDRRSLAAFYLRGLSLKEIAAEEQAPIGTIKRRLHTARRRLGDVLPADLLLEKA